MSDISKIDKNFKIETKIQKDDIKFISALENCFDIYGLMCTDGVFHRIPYDVAKNTSTAVTILNENTAGGRIRFKTNSKYVIVHSQTDPVQTNSHISVLGKTGFDLYLIENGTPVYFKSFIPPFETEETFEQIVEFPDNCERDILIHFPLYNTCKNLYIGVQQTSYVKNGSEYKHKKPMVFYGSSITQGGCASRPGNNYLNHISRYFDADFINLGFSGACKAEQAMQEYIPTIDMSIFVYDYEYNAPTPEYFAETHEQLFKKFREKQPFTPVIFKSNAERNYTLQELEAMYKRRKTIITTYNNAIADGDKNVYFLDGLDIFRIAGGCDCTVDGTHPNDLGFWCIGQAMIKVIKDNKLL